MVRSSSSTPLFANNRHIPDRVPEAEAYETARISGTRDLGPLESAKVEDVVMEGDLELDLLTIRGVVSVMIWLVVVIGFAVGGSKAGVNGGE